MNIRGIVSMATALAVAATLAGCMPKRDYASFAVSVNPMCTTCEDFVRCDAAAEGGGVQLVYLRQKPFLAQLATIADYLFQFFRDRHQDHRPVTIYTEAAGARDSGEAVTDLDRHRIQLPSGWIDQTDGSWHGADGAPLGRCRVLTHPEGRELARSLAGRPGA
jgi:hypothetical protein